MMRFCQMGTSAGGISTPRSPRATMTASAAATMSPTAASASFFSILATASWSPPAAAMASLRPRTSSARRTNESAT